MIAVHDDVLPDPQTYRARALAQTFGSVPDGDTVFHGIAACDDPALLHWLARAYPTLQPTWTFFRQSPAGQVEPNFIHTDDGMGDATVIFYLTDPPAPEDGTCFWRHRMTGADRAQRLTGAVGESLTHWQCYATVPAAFNRALIFDAPLCHSRAIHENYGTGATARLIQVVFGTWSDR